MNDDDNHDGCFCMECTAAEDMSWAQVIAALHNLNTRLERLEAWTHKLSAFVENELRERKKEG
jgi:hypothetical protein